MNYKQTLDYLYEQLPMFHRIGAAAYKADLDNTLAICKLLGNPENKFKSIHVGGTNGKGSSSHMLAACYQQAGYKTGLYTSPHLKDFRERIKINGKPIPQKKIISFVEQRRHAFEQIKPSFFEWTVGLAFEHFTNEKVDVAIIEVGLGGRLDSTNVITPLVSLITNIGHDHMALLGNTLQKIATEKAGIIKPGVPVVISQTQTETKKIFERRAAKCKSEIVFADKQLVHRKEKYLPARQLSEHLYNKNVRVASDLSGTYQSYNIGGVLATLQLANEVLPLTQKQIHTALRNVKKLTGLRGRWDLIQRHPRVICDTGHNTEGILEVLKCVDREFKSGVVKGKLHVVFGAVSDKDLKSVFLELKKNKHFKSAAYYFCKPNIPRGMETDILLNEAKKYSLGGKVYASVKKALAAAKKAAGARELVFAGGSTFVVAEIV